jgi:hypothetical protein
MPAAQFASQPGRGHGRNAPAAAILVPSRSRVVSLTTNQSLDSHPVTVAQPRAASACALPARHLQLPLSIAKELIRQQYPHRLVAMAPANRRLT